MNKAFEEHLDAMCDAESVMRLAAQILSDGDVSDRMAADLSWLLGSTRKRIQPVTELLEEMQTAQRAGDQPEPEIADIVFIGDEVLKMWERYAARKRAAEGGST